MHPGHVDGRDVLAGPDGYVRACGVSGVVAREGDVIRFDDRVIGYPFALYHPRRFVLKSLVVERGVAADIVRPLRVRETMMEGCTQDTTLRIRPGSRPSQDLEDTKHRRPYSSARLHERKPDGRETLRWR